MYPHFSQRSFSPEVSKIYPTRSIFIKSIISCTKRYDEKLPFNAPFFFYIRNRKPFLCKKLGTVTFDYWAKRVIKESAIKECKKREGKGRQGDKRQRKTRHSVKKKEKKNGIEFTFIIKEKKEAYKSLYAAYLLATFERAKFLSHRIFSHAVREFG